MSEVVSTQVATDFARFLTSGGEAALGANESPILTLEWLQPWRRHFDSGHERVFAVGGAATTQYPFCDIIAFSSSWRECVARAAKTGLVLWRQVRSQ